MKKTILTILLALLLLIPVFAKESQTASGSEEITLKLNLAFDPKYYFGVTANKLTGNETSLSSFTDKIELQRDDNDTLKLQESSSEFFFSYVFKEFENVQMTLKLNGDLVTDTGDDATDTGDDATKKIAYSVNFTKTGYNDTSDLQAIPSSDNGQHTLCKFNATEKIGYTERGSIGFKIAPTDTSIKGKVKGDYSTTLTLSIKSFS